MQVWPDFDKIYKDIFKNKILYIIGLPLAFIVAVIYSFSLPDYYKCESKISPEMPSKYSNLLSLTDIVSFVKSDVYFGYTSEKDFFPERYPLLIKSIDFQTSLFPIKIRRSSDGKEFTYYDYLLNEQKKTWWSDGISKLANLVLGRETIKPTPFTPNDVRIFKPNNDQQKVLEAINSKVCCQIDAKTFVVTIRVTDQDPLVAAIVADSVKARLQDFITYYVTAKYRADFEYNKKIYCEVKSKYQQSSRNYADFADANRDINSEVTRSKMQDLENEMNLRYNVYEKVSVDMIMAELEMQRKSLSFTSLQAPTVPLQPAGPEKLRMCFLFTFFVFYAITFWILYKCNHLKSFIGIK